MDITNDMIESSGSDLSKLLLSKDLDHFVGLISKKLKEYSFHLELLKRRATELDGAVS